MNPRRRSFWSEHEIAELRKLYPDNTAKAVSLVIDKSERAIYQKAKALELRKSAAFLASAQSGRVQHARQHPNMIAARIQPGAVPWNKGIKGSTGTQPGCRATQFKADGSLRGAAQHNYQPIGTLRTSKDGYLEQKVTDDHPVPARRWVAVHRIVWEAERGPIPAGHIVAFRPGMKTAVLDEVTADRLECISRAENARRNHPRSKSPELAKLVQLKGAITRQVNRIAREAKEAQP